MCSAFVGGADLQGKRDPELPSLYRPPCILYTGETLLEKLSRARLAMAIRTAGDLHDKQIGFRSEGSHCLGTSWRRTVESKPKVKYLRVMIDFNLSFFEQISKR